MKKTLLIIVLYFSAFSYGSSQEIKTNNLENKVLTNKDYREFVNWVRDSIMRRMLAEKIFKFNLSNQYENPYDLSPLNWKVKINLDNDVDQIDALEEDIFLENTGRPFYFYGMAGIDKRKIVFEYKDENDVKHSVGVYPDTLIWSNQSKPISDFFPEKCFSASIYDALSAVYFSNKNFDD